MFMSVCMCVFVCVYLCVCMCVCVCVSVCRSEGASVWVGGRARGFACQSVFEWDCKVLHLGLRSE